VQACLYCFHNRLTAGRRDRDDYITIAACRESKPGYKAILGRLIPDGPSLLQRHPQAKKRGLEEDRGFLFVRGRRIIAAPTREEATMRRCTAALLVTAFMFGCAAIRQESGWITLIDGTAKSLDNFDRIGEANWRVEDGAIVADKGQGGFLVSKNSYKDFVLRAEFWADHNTNSGVWIRATDPKQVTTKNAYEVNIYDQRPEPKYGTGAIVDVAEVSPMPKAGGRWNVYEITAKGSQIRVVLNGVQTVNVQNDRLPDGRVALQFGNHGKEPGGAIKWRRVQIRPL
jgi:hypothetical protein